MWYERRTCDSYACFVRSGYGLRKGWIYLLLIQPLIRFGARTHCFFNCILFFFQICSQKGLKQCVLMFLDRNARDMESSSSSSSIKVVYTCTCIQNAMEMFCGCIPPEYAKVVRHRYYCTHSTHTHNRSLNKLCGSPREPDSLRYPWGMAYLWPTWKRKECAKYSLPNNLFVYTANIFLLLLLLECNECGCAGEGIDSRLSTVQLSAKNVATMAWLK